MKKLFLFFGISLTSYNVYADIYDVYGIWASQVRDKLPKDVQCLIAQYLLPHINTQFLLKLKKDVVWKKRYVRAVRPKENFLLTRENFDWTSVRRSDPLEPLPSTLKKRLYLVEPVFYLKQEDHILYVRYRETHDCIGIISYEPGTVFESFDLNELTMDVYITIGTKEHIWKPSRNLEDYIPDKRVTLEQILFLMLLESVYAQEDTVSFEILAYKYREDLGKHIQDSSVFGIINYLRSILKSFGSLVEPLISQYYNGDNALTGSFNAKKRNNNRDSITLVRSRYFNTKHSDCFTCCIS